MTQESLCNVVMAALNRSRQGCDVNVRRWHDVFQEPTGQWGVYVSPGSQQQVYFFQSAVIRRSVKRWSLFGGDWVDMGASG